VFIDQVKIQVKAGSGGKGCQSFYRDKYNRRGTADGGSGGKGADIIIRSDRNLRTLLDFHYKRNFLGPAGGHGSGNNRKGKDAPAVVIKVPLGTTVKDIKAGCILRDLQEDQQEVVVVYGGGGGSGNKHNKPVTVGHPGEVRELLLDLKVIADVGVIGFPNAGKSTLISSISNAHPKIAAYPFTTKSPALGVVKFCGGSFVIADIPGLIRGSSEGRGLGDKFLRHVERTKILLHLIDMAGVDARDPIDDYRVINQELKNYSLEVYKKPKIMVANKMDLESAQDNLTRFKQEIKRKKVYSISALERQGLEELIEAIGKKLSSDANLRELASQR